MAKDEVYSGQCPKCDGNDIETEHSNSDGETLINIYKCNSCGEEFETYSVSYIAQRKTFTRK